MGLEAWKAFTTWQKGRGLSSASTWRTLTATKHFQPTPHSALARSPTDTCWACQALKTEVQVNYNNQLLMCVQTEITLQKCRRYGFHPTEWCEWCTVWQTNEKFKPFDTFDIVCGVWLKVPQCINMMDFFRCRRLYGRTQQPWIHHFRSGPRWLWRELCQKVPGGLLVP